MSQISITTLRPDQWREYKELRLEALRLYPDVYTETFEEFSQKPDSFWSDRLSSQNDTKLFLFARVDTELIGMIVTDRHYDDPTKLFIMGVYVKTAHHGSTVAAELFHTVFDRIRPIPDIATLTLTVYIPNPRAVVFYQKMGFAILKTQKVSRGAAEVEEYVMERPVR